MPDLPTGTVTFLFTDIEGSTNLARALGPRWQAVLEEHHQVLRSAIRGHDGIDIRTEGDAFFAVFTSAVDAVEAAADAQRGLAGHDWPADGVVRVRMGMHTGEGRLGGDEYVGLDVHLAARIAAAGHGGQVLISGPTRALAEGKLAAGVGLRDLGEHRLKDFDTPQHIHQLVIEGLSEEFPPLRSLEVPVNLPVQLTSFVGRQGELVEVETLLSTTRLLTLVGPGGTGKTRLAVEVAGRVAGGYPDGVYFVDLAPLRDPALVPSSIVRSLGLKEQAVRPALETVVRHLADRRALLILDNVEQVVAAAPAAGAIVEASPGSTVLATSRVRLGLRGEREYPVPPLGLPHGRGNLDALAGNEAVALFAERARAADPSFELTRENAETVAEICARLDGLPLAIELATAQLRLLSPAELLERLDRRLPLRAGALDVPERQRTLRSTIEWSHQLLGPPARRLFARMGAFVGGASFDAVEQVADPDGELGMDTLDALGSLVDHSLVRRDDGPGGSRFSMLETIHEYAGDRLREEADHAEIRRRHAEHFAALAVQWSPKIRSPEALQAATRLGLEHANIRAALDWALREGAVELASRVVEVIWMYWVEAGHLAEGRRTIDRLLGHPGVRRKDAVRARVLTALGAVTYWAMDYPAATAAYREAADITREVGDGEELARALANLAYGLLAQAQGEAAIPVIEESVRLARAAGDERTAMITEGQIGLARAQAGDYEAALESMRRSETALQALAQEGQYGAVWIGEWHGRIAAILRLLGRLDEARDLLVTSLVEARDVVGPIGIATVGWQLASVESARGDHDLALRLGGFAEATFERLGGSPPRALMLLPELATIREAASTELDPGTADRLWAAGRAMTPAEAISLAAGDEP